MSVKFVEQYCRAIRWYKVLQDVYNAKLSVSQVYHTDYLYAFFTACYHLKDYIKNDTNFVLAEKSKAVEDYVNGDVELSVCGDFCNGSKHLKLNLFG